MADGKMASAPRRMVVTVVEEHHRAVVRRVAGPEELTACCRELEEEFGKCFRLLPHGGLVPAAARIERVKIGKIVQDRPKLAWRWCPFCGAELVADTQTAVMPPKTQNPEPKTGA